MPQAQATTAHPNAVIVTRTRSWIYVGLALSMSATAFWGFSYTYFMPLMAGAYPQVSPVVYLHGWSFFLWFLLLPAQAFLMAKGHRRAHMTLGAGSVAWPLSWCSRESWLRRYA
ncbi:MAG: hypothetical protein SFU57_02575 [Gemmatimonadales bacterium]|nr:hypothetical protein [Gemmatimonadales bacterium]